MASTASSAVLSSSNSTLAAEAISGRTGRTARNSSRLSHDTGDCRTGRPRGRQFAVSHGMRWRWPWFYSALATAAPHICGAFASRLP